MKSAPFRLHCMIVSTGIALAGIPLGDAVAQSFTGIGDLAPNPPFSSKAFAVSPDGLKVTGVTTIGDDDGADGVPNTKAFVWSSGSGMTALASFSSSIYYGQGHGITNGGIVAGYGDSLDPEFFYQAGTPMRWDPNPTALAELPAIWNNDSYLAGANAINGSGAVIVGYASDFDEGGNDRGIVWVNNIPQALDWLNVSSEGPTIYVDYMYTGGVNTPGTNIVGASYNFTADDGAANGQAVMWSDATAQWSSAAAKTPVGLGFVPGADQTADGTTSGGNDVSNNGQLIVGYSENGAINSAIPDETPLPAGREVHVGFLVNGVLGGNPNPMIALADIGSNNGSTDLQFAAATAVNGDASATSYVAVGWGYNGLHDLGGPEANDDGVDGTDLSREALMWTPSGVQNIETFAASLGLNLTGWDLQEATGISDNGCVIVGWGFNPQGNSEGWVLSLPSSAIAGDFDLNGAVNGLDLAQWKGDFGGPGSDADGDNDSDGNDFLIWQRNFGAGPGVNAVPESNSAALIMIAGALVGFAGRLKSQPPGRRR